MSVFGKAAVGNENIITTGLPGIRPHRFHACAQPQYMSRHSIINFLRVEEGFP